MKTIRNAGVITQAVEQAILAAWILNC